MRGISERKLSIESVAITQISFTLRKTYLTEQEEDENEEEEEAAASTVAAKN